MIANSKDFLTTMVLTYENSMPAVCPEVNYQVIDLTLIRDVAVARTLAYLFTSMEGFEPARGDG